MGIQEKFANTAQASAEDCAAVTNLVTENSTYSDEVALYTNYLSTKKANNKALQTAVRNLQGEINNLWEEVVTLKRSGPSGGAGAANK